MRNDSPVMVEKTDVTIMEWISCSGNGFPKQDSFQTRSFSPSSSLSSSYLPLCYSLNKKCAPISSHVECLAPSWGALWGNSRDFRRCSLAGEIVSLGTCL